MFNQDTTPESEVNLTPDATVNNEPDNEQGAATLADLHEDTTPAKKTVTNVPISRLNKEIQKRKELEKRLAELESNILDSDTSDDDVEDAESEVKQLAQKLEQIEERDRRKQLEAVFSENLSKTLENAPEYKDVVNVEVIKQMAFNPANKNKTYKQLLEEAYGNAIVGRRTIETSTPRGGAKDSKVDVQLAQKDAEYRRKVLSDPDLRKQYNDGIENRIFR